MGSTKTISGPSLAQAVVRRPPKLEYELPKIRAMFYAVVCMPWCFVHQKLPLKGGGCVCFFITLNYEHNAWFATAIQKRYWIER